MKWTDELINRFVCEVLTGCALCCSKTSFAGWINALLRASSKVLDSEIISKFLGEDEFASKL